MKRLTQIQVVQVSDLLRRVCHKDAATGLAIYARDWSDERVSDALLPMLPQITRVHVARIRGQLIGLTHPQKAVVKPAAREISMAAAIEMQEQIQDLNERLTSLERSLGVTPPKKADEETPRGVPGARWFGGRSK